MVINSFLLKRLFFYKKLVNLNYIKIKINNIFNLTVLLMGVRYNKYYMLSIKKLFLILNYVFVILIYIFCSNKLLLCINLQFKKLHFKILHFFFKKLNFFVFFRWTYGFLTNFNLIAKKNKILNTKSLPIKPHFILILKIDNQLQLNEISKLNVPIFSFLINNCKYIVDYPIPFLNNFEYIYFFMKILNYYLKKIK